MLRSFCIAALATAALVCAQQYQGPLPAKPDLPYIKQAATLIPTEVTEARAETGRDSTRYVIQGAESTVKTPISLPIFILKAEKLSPERLQLYRVEVKSGNREFTVGGANPPDVLHMEVSKLTPDGLCRIAVSDPLENGEYALRSEGSAQVFCFQVF
jgi:hypothetical protein